MSDQNQETSDLKEEFSDKHGALTVSAKFKAPLIGAGKIYVLENNIIPPTDADKLFGYDPLEFANFDGETQGAITGEFIKIQTKRYEEAQRLTIATYENNFEFVKEHMLLEQEGVANKIAETELSMAKDSGFSKKIKTLIENGKSAETAIHETYSKYIDLFAAMDDERMASKVDEIRQIQATIQHHLHSDKTVSTLEEAPEGSIIFTPDIPVAMLCSFIDRNTGKSRFNGIICTKGSMSGHAAIMARSLRIPYAKINKDNAVSLKSGYDCILNGIDDEIIFQPSKTLKKQYEGEEKDLFEAREILAKKWQDLDFAKTRDGFKVNVHANFEISAEAQALKNANPRGIGLYRTEMADSLRETWDLTEDGWYDLFDRNLRACAADKQTHIGATLRTIDISGDKEGRHGDKTRKEKEAAIQGITRKQMAAALRLYHDTKQGDRSRIKMMVPLIGSVEQMEAMQAIMNEEAERLNLSPMKLGCMVEVPSLLSDLDKLDVDFMSVGSNDLIHSILGSERFTGDGDKKYDPTNQAVLEALKAITTAGKNKGIPVSLCGDIASDPKYTGLLIGLGYHNLSAGLDSIPLVKEIASRVNSQKAELLVEQLLGETSRDMREEMLSKFNEGIGLHDKSFDLEWTVLENAPTDNQENTGGN